MTQRPVNRYNAYHAHIYFGPETVEQARGLREAASRELPVSVGRFHEKNVGPHLRWSSQMAFTHEQFDTVVPWLESHRNGLTIFVHGLTGNDLEDHTTHAYWPGEPAELNVDI